MPLNFETREVILEKLTSQQQAQQGFSHRARFKFDQINDVAALSKTFSFPVGAGCVVRGVAHVTKEGFVGPSVTSLVVSVGNDAESDNFMTTKQCVSGSVAADSFAAPAAIIASADTIDIKFTAIGANLNVLTAGEVWVLLELGNVRIGSVE